MSNKIELYQQLAQLKEQYPERFEEAVKEHPEWFRVILDEQRELELLARVKTDTPDGFFAYYEGKYGFPPPVQTQEWIREIYKGHEQNMGFTLNGHRGSWKTITISISFLEYRIGLEPHKTNLVIRASDVMANEITDKIVMTIQYHPWWKVCFPNVVPDEAGKWSANGYWVVDTSISRDEWTKKTSDTADPTLVGGGYTSQKINGKHPSGVCLTDDLHGINNSFSDTERKAVTEFYTIELSKTFIRKDGKLVTWPINIGVPWGRDDVHQTLAASGGYISETYPVMIKAREGDKGAVYIDGVNKVTGITYKDIVGWWILSSPSLYGVEDIIRERGLSKHGFFQMFMMDLTSAQEGSLKYYIYPHNNVDEYWRTAGGVDVPYDFEERHNNQTKLSSFAMAFVSQRPERGAVLVGGVVDHPTIAQAFNHILAAQSNFINWIFTFCENVGGGRVFISSAKTMFPHMKIMGSDLGKIIRLPGEGAGKAKNKKTRIQTELAPWLENGTVLISDKDDPYLNLVRDALDNFSELRDRGADDRLDVLDAFYHAVKGMPEVLVGQRFDEELPSIFKKEKAPHPLAGRNHR